MDCAGFSNILKNHVKELKNDHDKTIKIAQYLIKILHGDNFSDTGELEFISRYIDAIKNLSSYCSRQQVSTTLTTKRNELYESITGANPPSHCSFLKDIQREISQIIISTKCNESTALCILKILEDYNRFWTIENLKEVVVPALEKISEPEEKEVLKMSYVHTLGVSSPFWCKILLRNNDKKCRDLAYQNLIDIRKSLTEHYRKVVDIEQECRKSKSFLQDCSERLSKGFSLTITCFEKMAECFDDENIPKILEIVAKRQIIPAWFANNFKANIQHINPESVYKISEQLFIKKLIEITDIKDFILERLDEKDEKIFDFLTAVNKLGNAIPEDIINKLENIHTHEAQVTWQYLNRKETFFSVLKNPRRTLSNRKNALKGIVENHLNHNQKTTKLLTTLCVYERDLRYDSFKAIVSILADCNENHPEINVRDIDWKTTISNMNNTKLDLTDLIKLMKKSETVELNASANILTWITEKKTSYSDEEFVEFTKCFVRTESGAKTSEYCKQLLNFILCLKNSKKRDEAIDVIMGKINKMSSILTGPDKMVNFEIFKFGGIENSGMKSLVSLQDHIAQGYPVPTGVISVLIEHLKHKYPEMKESDQISQILRDIYNKQKLDVDFAVQILNTMINYDELFLLPELVFLIEICFTRDYCVPDEIAKPFTAVLRKNIEKIVKKSRSIEKGINERAAGSLNDLADKTTVKIVNMLKVADTIFTKYVTLEFKSQSEIQTFLDKEHICVKILFINLLLKGFTISSSTRNLPKFAPKEQFLKEFRNHSKNKLYRCFNSDDLKALVTYINSELVSTREKFYILKEIDEISEKLRFKNQIFKTSILPKEMRKEFLKSVLIVLTKSEEIKKNGFNKNIKELEELLQKLRTNLNNSIDYRIEDILKVLICKQKIFNLDIDDINVIILTATNKTILDSILHDNSETFITGVKKLWLDETKFKKSNTPILESDKQKMEEFYDIYKLRILNSIFNGKRSVDFFQLLELFKTLEDCSWTIEKKMEFLCKDMDEKSSIQDCTTYFNKKLIEELLETT